MAALPSSTRGVQHLLVLCAVVALLSRCGPLCPACACLKSALPLCVTCAQSACALLKLLATVPPGSHLAVFIELYETLPVGHCHILAFLVPTFSLSTLPGQSVGSRHAVVCLRPNYRAPYSEGWQPHKTRQPGAKCMAVVLTCTWAGAQRRSRRDRSVNVCQESVVAR